MLTYEYTVRHVREEQDAHRELNHRPPVTDHNLINILLSMKHFSAAEWLSEQVYKEK